MYIQFVYMKLTKLPTILSFEWDEWNIKKNWNKHKVKPNEAEEAFIDKKRVVFGDVKHSEVEERFVLLGKTKRGKKLYIAFTKRGKRIRVISARPINRKEVLLYEKAINIA